ncbi:hypothetical protein GCK72_007194 [Caenorhabditis remanei]|uniref:Uncharacterized protein n=1 Tax=Caenorhabditis remanei TaxID=31234 RepID=A0A6A5HIF5_CAERE|nr:hypothetical protein GCK72_007194 [Caenorhabditis remanei]KAF1767235.1 hypothetical protein GCK72_007194 [Caenorhabditis remanei]
MLIKPLLVNGGKKCNVRKDSVTMQIFHQQYIEHLKKLVRPLTHSDFCANVTNERRIRNSYGERVFCKEVQRIVPKGKSCSISLEPEKKDQPLRQSSSY